MSKKIAFEEKVFSEAEIRKLKFRAFLMITLMKYIRSERITQIQAAKRLKVSQSRISHLMRCKLNLFSADTLLEMLERAGFKIYEKMEQEIADAITRVISTN